LLPATGDAQIVYQDTFDGNPPAVPATVTVTGNQGETFVANGDSDVNPQFLPGSLAYVTNGGGGHRTRYSVGAFDLSDGFTLDVDFTFGGNPAAGNNQFSFGVAEILDPEIFNNVINGDPSGESGIGFGVLGGAEVVNLEGLLLAVADPTGELEGTVTELDDTFELSSLALDTSHNVVLTLTPDGSGGADWEYSVNGGTAVVGNITTFNFAADYSFFVHGRDDETTKSLQEVTLTALTDGDGSPAASGDFTNDGIVDCDDLDGYIGNIGAMATEALAVLDIDGNGTIEASDANTHITTLVTTSNGIVGTNPGDVNCDGVVNVLGDALALVTNLGSNVMSYSQGDVNFDGQVNVLGDALILVTNLGMSNQ